MNNLQNQNKNEIIFKMINKFNLILEKDCI